jgi:aspartate aminotransferase-like enzyme
MGLSLFAKRPSNGVTAVQAPSGVDTKKLVKVIQDRYQITLAGGQGEMAGKVFRIAHMGAIGPFDILVAVGAVELGLMECGASVTPGEGVKAAHAVIGNLAPLPAAPARGVRGRVQLPRLSPLPGLRARVRERRGGGW